MGEIFDNIINYLNGTSGATTGVLFVFIIIATFFVAYLFRRFYFGRLRRSTFIPANPTGFKFIGHTISALIYLVGFGIAIYFVPSLRSVASTMFAGAGIAAVVIGFASQKALSNVVAGLFVVIFKPFKLGDRLLLQNGMTGVVEDITLRHTVIRNFENRRIVIPNSIISEDIITNSDLNESRVCRFIDIGISYNSNIDLARKIMQEECANHPLLIDSRSPEELEAGVPLVPVRVIALGDFSITMRASAWANTSADSFAMYCDLLESIKKRFDAEGVEIPFPHRTVIMKNSNS